MDEAMKKAVRDMSRVSPEGRTICHYQRERVFAGGLSAQPLNEVIVCNF